MNGPYDEDRRLGGDGSLDVRGLLEEASWPPAGRGTAVEPEDSWADGRRRRSRRRVGAGVVAGVSTLAVAGLVWQTGVFDGSTRQEPQVATVPSGMTTFVLADESAGVDPSAAVPAEELSVPGAQELVGTSWVLTDQVYGSDQVASQIIGAETDTVFTFTEESWGFLADGCGGAGDQGPVEVDVDGAFAAPHLATDDQGCPEPAQAAEDFWMDALAGGGTLHLVGDGDWLLLSVEVPGGVALPDEVVGTADPEPTGTTAPSGPEEGEEPTGQSPSDDPSSDETPTGESPTEPSTPGPTDPGAGGTLDGFTPADQVLTGPGWPSAGGQLLAPTVRAGLNDGFDRVVVDLTGTGEPTWRASYPEEALRDGSGLPAGVAGDSVLEVVIGGMGYPEPGDPVYDDGDIGLDTHRLDGVVEVIRTTPFEGQLQLFVGLEGEPRPYRVFLLQEPLRLVVDVQHAG